MQGRLIVQSGHYININDVAFSPDGREIVTCSADESIRVWDVVVGCEVAVLRGHTGPVYHAVFDGAGARLVSGGWDHSVRVWDVRSRRTERVLAGIERHPVDALALSASGTRVAATGTGVQNTPRKLLVWDATTGETLHALDVPGRVGGSSTALAFSSDGSLLAYADAEERVHLLDVATGTDRILFEIAEEEREAPAGNGEEHGGIEFVRATIGDVLLVDGGRLVVVSRGAVRVVDVATAAVVRELLPASPRHRARLLASGDLALFGEDGVEVWNLEAGTRRASVVAAAPVAMSPDGRLVAGVDGRHLLLFDAGSGRLARRLGSRLRVPFQPGNRHRQFVAACSPAAPVIASAAPDGSVRLWDLASSPTPRVFQAHEGAVDDLAFDSTGRFLATAGSDGARVWRLGDLVALWGPPESGAPAARCVAFSAEGSAVVVGGWDGVVWIFDLATGEQLAREDFGTMIESVAVSPWNHVAVTVFDTLAVWEPFRGQRPEPGTIGVAANGVAFDRTGRLAVALGFPKWFGGYSGGPAGKGVVMLADPGEQPAVVEGHDAAVKVVAFSPHGETLLTGGEDGRLLTWRRGAPEPETAVEAHTGDVTAAAFTFDGRFAVSMGLDGAVRLWESGGHLAATLLSLDDDDFVAVTDDNHYAATKTGLGAVVLDVDGALVAFEQFDLQLNRPDLVLARLGYASPEVVGALAELHARRLQRLGASDVEHDPASAPHVVIEPLPPAVVDGGVLPLAVGVRAGGSPVDRVMVFVNDVPAHGRSGVAVDAGAADQTVEVEVELAAGDNDVQVWAVDQRGVQSLRRGFRVFSSREEPARTLYVLAVGVSSYAAPGYDLEYAAKDARDLAAELERLSRRFARVETRVLEDAPAAAIRESRAFLEQGTVDDQVVMLFAGHGTVAGGDFVFLPADFDPADPAATGIGYEELELLVDGIRPRRRLLLLDACHSGEAEGEGEGDGAFAVPLPSGVRSVRAFRDLAPVGGRRAPAARQAPFVATLQEVFADLRQESGAYVLAASGAAEFAFESEDIQNGVFTASVIRAMRDAADDGLTVSALARRVADDVRTLTNGGQRPVSRRENLADDFYVI